MREGIFAHFKTEKGNIKIQLTYDKTPGTVGNFVGLTEGSLENKVSLNGEPYYDGLKFHRVIPDFMIQGGCPDGKHTVFGLLVEGQEVVDSIAQGDAIQKITIERVGADAKAWDANSAFDVFVNEKEERLKALREAAENELDELTEGMDRTDSGLFYKITRKGFGNLPPKGCNVSVHYTGMMPDGTIFDSSYKRNEPISFPLGKGRVIKGWDEGIALLKKGSVAKLVIPSELAYGSRGVDGVIPPDATLIFEVELVDF